MATSAKCEHELPVGSIIFKAWTGDRSGTVQCTIPTQYYMVYHHIKIVNWRQKNFTVDVKGSTGSGQNLEFEHCGAIRTKGAEWKTPGIKIGGATKRGKRSLIYSHGEATVMSISSTSGEEPISTEFTYVFQGEGNYPPVQLNFNVDF